MTHQPYKPFCFGLFRRVFVLSLIANVHAELPPITATGTTTIAIGSAQGSYNNALPGSTVVFRNTAATVAPYQWLFNGQPIAGATDPAQLTLSGVRSAQAGYYLLRDAQGETSSPFALSVFTPPDFPVDKTFTAAFHRVTVLGVDSVGAIIAAVSTIADAGSYEVKRLRPDGTVDPSFTYPSSAGNVLLVLPDGSMITSKPPYRLRPDGLPNPLTLPPGLTTDRDLVNAVVQSDGKLVLAQHVDRPVVIPPPIGGETLMKHWVLGRLNADGTYDPSFTFGPPRFGELRQLIASRSGGFIVNHARGNSTPGQSYSVFPTIDRLLDNGEVDPAQSPRSTFYPSGYVVAERSDGRLLIGGTRSDIINFSIANADGTRSEGFTDFTLTGYAAWTLLSDDSFVHASPSSSARTIIRREPTRYQIDPTYQSGNGTPDTYNSIQSLRALPGGDLLVTGQFTAWAGHPTSAIARLNPTTISPQDSPCAPIIRASLNGSSGSGYSDIHRGDRFEYFGDTTGGTASTYEWISVDGHVLPTPTHEPQLVHSALELSDLGITGLRVTNPSGTLVAAPITLRTTKEVRLINLSGRVAVGPGEETPVVGLVLRLTSTGWPQRVLLRGIGPSLADFGVTDALVDPWLRWIDAQGTVFMANDDWAGTADLVGAMTQTGAFALSPTSHDAAFLTDIATNNPNTFQLTAAPESPPSGVALMEIYDLGNARSGGSYNYWGQLANLSLRAKVGTGNETLVGGFVIRDPHGFDRPLTLLIRAIGPTLADHHIANADTDPVLSIFDASGQQVDQNDNWADRPELAPLTATTAQVGAFPIPEGSKDAAMLVTLPAGAYTAHITSNEPTGGIALLEIYLAP